MLPYSDLLIASKVFFVLLFFFCSWLIQIHLQRSPTHCIWLLTPSTIALQAPLSREFSGQEYWSGLPFPSPGDLPDPGVQPASLA